MISYVLKFGKSLSFLTDGIFEAGAYGVPSKSQNPTALGQSGTQCNCNVLTLVRHIVGTVHLTPTTNLHFSTVLKMKYLF